MIRSLQPTGHCRGSCDNEIPTPCGDAAAMPGHSASQTSAVALDRIARTARR
jgi:hypothetical protein